VVLTQQRLYAKVIFDAHFAVLHANAFQEFFHKLMQYRYPTFLPVVPYGKLGDQGSDGLSTLDDKLYACYGPESPNVRETTRKFHSDLASAIAKRTGQFSTFVFVHNDRRGMHPQIATEIIDAAHTHPTLTFQQMGKVAIWREFMGLGIEEAEDMLGQEIRVEELVYGLSLADLEPLLTHLGRNRDRSSSSDPKAVPLHKLEFNRLSPDIQDYVIHCMRFAKQVDDYYQGIHDVPAEDEVAAAFKERYVELRDLDLTPDEVFQELLVYVIGNMVPTAQVWTSAYTILSYFLGKCHIFEEPPDDYIYSTGGGS
jgi:hypothetical protein